MSYNIHIERIEPNNLQKVIYRYWQRRDMDFELDFIGHYSRPSKRHHWRVVGSWDRLKNRSNTMERIEPSQDIKDSVRKIINDKLRFI